MANVVETSSPAGTDEIDEEVDDTSSVDDNVVSDTETDTTDDVDNDTSDNTDDKSDTDDDDEPISRKEAKKLRSENRGLRTVKNNLAAENETLKNELEQLKEKVSTFELEKEEAAYNNMVNDVKKKYNLTDRLAKYLKGDTVEELEKSASEIVEDYGVKTSVDVTNLHNGDGNKSSPVDYSKLSPAEIRELVRSKKLS